MFYFYCPKCGSQKMVDKLPKEIVCNMRGGYGTPIYHYKCKLCGNLNAGFMKVKEGDMNEIIYYRSVISLYQGIRSK